MSDLSDRIAHLSPAKRELLGLCLEKKGAGQPLAVLGVACRFPGAPNPEAFWQLLAGGKHAITEVPPERWDINSIYHPDPNVPGKMNTRWGGFLEQGDRFDCHFFGISPREAAHMDPQQRLLLEVAWEALENAGVAPDRLAGTKTGVFVGISSRDYSQCQVRQGDVASIDAYSGTGNAGSIAANRLSYLLDLRGPSFAVDTACSSALYAVHLGVQSLRHGESDLALVAGVNFILAPEVTVAFSRARMMSPTGRCKTFDATADGYVRGEGCGVLVLKRLVDALRDGDPILALVRGSAVNHDGRTPGLTVPSPQAQQGVIRQALADGGVSPADLSYFEAHGTATPVGDRIEVQALAEVVKEGRPAGRECALGSVKTNIGHLEAAAGVASLIKVVLALQHETIPPQLNLKEINPHIAGALKEASLVIPTQPRPWRRGERPRFAGISGYGFGGANAHVVLEEAPQRPAADAGPERPTHVLALSAKSEKALRNLARAYADRLTTAADPDLADVCNTADAGRAHFEHRLAVAADSASRLAGQLIAFASGEAPPGLHHGQVKLWKRPKVAFLFTGQGAQYPGMGRRLYETQPTFRAALDRCTEVLRGELEQPLLAVLHPETQEPALVHETAYTQPALFALEYALAELWKSWGVVPDAVLGHSVGEFAAACVAGACSLEDGLRLVAERARRMQALPPMGKMAVVFAAEDRVAAALAPYRDRAAIAAVNGPANTVISGSAEAVEAVLAALAAQGVKATPLTVSHAFHSPLLEPMLGDWERWAGQTAFAAPRVPVVSNLTGRPFGQGEAPDAGYWRRHAREPVRFADGMAALAALGCDVFLEIGPSPTLLGMGKACLPENAGVWLPSLRPGQDDWQSLPDSLARLYVAGVEVHWAGFDRDYPRRRVLLPNYPFERERHWVDFPKPAAKEKRAAVPETPAFHPLLGRRVH